MAFSTKLFRVIISNNYYKSKSSDDFYIQPTKPTERWMKRRKVCILNHQDGIELLWLSENYDNPLELFQTKVDGVTLSFVMTLKNNQLLNLSNLEVGHPTGQVYYLHNLHNNNSNLLHSKDFISKLDLFDIKNIVHYPTQPGWNIFAIIDINCNEWFHQLSKSTSSLFAGPKSYEIKIQNRSTFWRYYFIDTKKRLNGTIKILSKGDPSYFDKVKASKDLPNVYCIESINPIKLYDQYDWVFSLYEIDKNGTKSDKILLEQLPYPTYDSLKKDKKNKKKHYSDIVVYV